MEKSVIFDNQIIHLRRIMYQLSAACTNKRNEIACLHLEFTIEVHGNGGLNNQNQ